MGALPENRSSKNLKIDYGSADTLAGTDPAEFNRSFSEPGNSGPDIFCAASVRPGFCIYATRMDPRRIPGYGFEIERAPFQFAFCLSGRMHTVFKKRRQSRNADFINQAGTNSICSMSRVSGQSWPLSDETFNCVALQIDREVLAAYLSDGMGKVTGRCRCVIDGEMPICGLPMTTEMYLAASQVFTTLFMGSTRQLYLEAKALELLAIQIEHMTRESLSEKSLSGSDLKRIRSAGEILIHKMQAPPTITALARMVGINEFKLKKGFKQVFGSTIFQFLQYHRMAYAKDMILSKGATVNQAADFVGYVNIGHFIACYKKTFGTTPGNHKRNGSSR